MASPLLRKILHDISPDPRWIKAMEDLLANAGTGTAVDVTALMNQIADAQQDATTALNQAAAALAAIAANAARNGSFYSTANQACPAADTPTVATFNVSRGTARGVYIASGSRITVTKNGKYKLTFRIQL